jgi:hypothetical protein
VKFELNDTGTGVWPSFIRRALGVDTVLMDRISHPAGEALPLNNDNTFYGRICYAGVEWSVTSSDVPPDTGPGVEHLWTMCEAGASSLPDSPYGFVGVLYGRFDNWAYYDHYETDRECPYCSCFCRSEVDIDDYECIPETLTATIVPRHDPATYSAPRLDYKEITLKQNVDVNPSGPYDLAPVKLRWRAQEIIDDRYHPSASFWLSCVEVLTLKTDFDGIYIGSSGNQPPDWTKSICRPLELYFGPINSSATQCDGGVGVQLEADPTSDCLADTPENIAFLDGLRWDIVITI